MPTLDDQLDAYLSDSHSIEEQALAQLRAAPRIAGDDRLAAALRRHLDETEVQLRRVRERLEARGGSPSRFKKAVMQAGGAGFVLFAASQPDTPGKLAAHAYSYEALEMASYELLEHVARLAGDDETAEVARVNGREEATMAQRLGDLFDDVAAASLDNASPRDAADRVTSYLADAHAIEQQSMKLLEKAPGMVQDPELARPFAEHLEETREQSRRLEERLRALGSSPSRIKDAAMRLGALNWGAFFAAHPDTPGKLAGFAFAVEHLEAAGYELLRRVAEHADDGETATLAREILAEEREAAGRIRAQFARAADASLHAAGVQA